MFKLTLGVIAVAAATLGLFVAFANRRTQFVNATFPDGVNVLQDGDFEDGLNGGNPPFQPNPDGVMFLPVGRTTIPGWTVVGAPGLDIAWAENGNRFGALTTNGRLFLDLTGNDHTDQNGNFGGVAQTFNTGVNKPYLLRYQIGVKNTDFPGPIRVVASVSNGPNDSPYAQAFCPVDHPFDPPHSDPGSKWTTTECRLAFVALSGSTTLKINGVQVSNAPPTHYIGLDAVDVECVSPLGEKGFCL
jgi:hypothetical protein